MRRLGTSGPNLLFERKRWVLRGVSRAGFPKADIREWRAAVAAMHVDSPSDELCHEASCVGVLLVASLAGSPDHVAREIRRLSRWPAVGIAVLPSDLAANIQLRSLAPNLLFAQAFAGDDVVAPASWAQAAVCEVDDALAFGRQITHCTLPTIAMRRSSTAVSVAAARAECDQLQADLAPVGDFSGYLIQPGVRGESVP